MSFNFFPLIVIVIFFINQCPLIYALCLKVTVICFYLLTGLFYNKLHLCCWSVTSYLLTTSLCATLCTVHINCFVPLLHHCTSAVLRRHLWFCTGSWTLFKIVNIYRSLSSFFFYFLYFGQQMFHLQTKRFPVRSNVWVWWISICRVKPVMLSVVISFMELCLFACLALQKWKE